MHTLLLEIVWFLPWCWFVNMSFTMFGYIMRPYSNVDKSLDGGLIFYDHSRLLGDSTTWGGLALAILLGIAGEAVVPGRHFLALALMVFAGHALGSFIKRRLSLARGAYLPFIDHVDYLILIALVSFIAGLPSLPAVVVAYGATLLLTPVVTYVAFRLGVRRQKL